MELEKSLKDNLGQVFISTKKDKIKKLIFILMESPFYMTLSVKERYKLLEKLLENYPSFFDNTN